MAEKRFELEQVLKYRMEVERMRTLEFAVARRDFEHASDQLSREEARVVMLGAEFTQRHADMNCIEELRLYADFFSRKRDEIKDQQERVNQLGYVMSDRREILLEAAKDKKVLESLKDKKAREFRQSMDKREQNFMDEIAVQKKGKDLTMKRTLFLCVSMIIVAGSLSLDTFRLGAPNAGAESDAAPKAAQEADQQPISASRAAREEKAIQDARRQQLTEKEAAVAAKEQELKKLAAKIEAQIKSLEESKKRLDESLKAQTAAQKKQQDEKVLKMVKLFKTMRGEQAGQMINNLQEPLALVLLSKMDTKTVAKLAPFINQPRVVKWVTENLQSR